MDTQDLDTSIVEIEEAQEVKRSINAASPDAVAAICTRYGFQDQVQSLVERELDIAAVKKEIVALWGARAVATTFAPAVHTRTQEPFSVGKAFTAAAKQDWSKAGLEAETCQELARGSQRGWERNTVMIDSNAPVKTRAALTGSGATTSGYGADLVGTDFHPERVVDALFARTFLDKCGVDRVLGLQGNLSFPVISSNASSSFVAEDASIGSEQRVATALKSLSPKEMVSKFAFSRQLLIQGLPNVEQIILNQLYQSIAKALDAAAIANSGVTLSTTGLQNQVTQIVAMGTNGGSPTLKSFYDMRKLLVAANVDVSGAKLLVSGALYETLATTLKDSGNTNSGYILPEGASSVSGLPLVWSQNVPANITKGSGTNLSMAVIGDFSNLIVAQFGAIAVEVDTISSADYSQTVLRAWSYWDMAIKRLAAFATVKDYIA